MSLFKCKMCGGDLDIVEGASIAECDYCGTRQPVPKAVDENLQNLFNRANALRIKSEFDKAEKIYERIIQADSTQADAYWGLILCKYGIEYVDDPETYEKIPTCHRASYDSIIADDDYKAALANADMSQRILYEKQAHEIDRIQKEILALAQQEEAYDVFICYKETDPSGARTRDSVIANDIYHQLTNEGYKVFYAAITLEGKLGSAYEPIIFAALNSAKVMLAIGTKPEYFTAVWVKNEWSRYLKIVKQDHSKLLIPCYKDMDAYELPEEFAHLQAQDMSKIGFINDLIRGIKKVLQKDEPKVVETTVVQQTVVSSGDTPNTESLLKRAFIFLEDGDWTSANEYCEKVLDIDPENAEAYLGKLMAELQVRKKSYLNYCKEPFDGRSNYKKVIRFGNASLVKEMEQYNTDIRETIYREAEALAEQNTPRKLFEASEKFKEIPGYRDADERAEECSEKSCEIMCEDGMKMAKEATTSAQCEEAYQFLLGLAKSYPPAEIAAEICKAMVESLRLDENKEKIYTLGLRLINEGTRKKDISMIEKAIEGLKQLGDWKDSSAQIDRCHAAIADINYEEALELLTMGKDEEDISSIEEAIQKFQSIIDWKDSSAQIDRCRAAIADIKDVQERKRIAHKKAVKKAKKIAAIVMSIVIVAVAFVIILNAVIIPNGKYNDAMALMTAEKYTEAITAFQALGGYRDSADKINECQTAISDGKYNEALNLMNAGKYSEAITAFQALNGYKDSAEQIEKCYIAIYGEDDWNKIKNTNVGDTYIFGSYEQDNNISNGKEDIEWIVLAKEGTRILVISKYALDLQRYNITNTDITWEDCTLRAWLNNEFLVSAFSDDERIMIPIVTVSADENPSFATNPGNATQDQVFLLSVTEAQKYFNSDDERECKPTDYVQAQDARVEFDNGNCSWWLRSPGNAQNFAVRVGQYGGVFLYGSNCNYSVVTVRPALWIELDS